MRQRVDTWEHFRRGNAATAHANCRATRGGRASSGQGAPCGAFDLHHDSRDADARTATRQHTYQPGSTRTNPATHGCDPAGADRQQPAGEHREREGHDTSPLVIAGHLHWDELNAGGQHRMLLQFRELTGPVQPHVFADRLDRHPHARWVRAGRSTPAPIIGAAMVEAGGRHLTRGNPIPSQAAREGHPARAGGPANFPGNFLAMLATTRAPFARLHSGFPGIQKGIPPPGRPLTTALPRQRATCQSPSFPA
jgi:hypothetical protein